MRVEAVEAHILLAYQQAQAAQVGAVMVAMPMLMVWQVLLIVVVVEVAAVTLVVQMNKKRAVLAALELLF
jgi:hypothetical protein